MQNQRTDLWLYAKYVSWARKNEWALETPIRHIQKFFHPHHRLLSRTAYFQEVMRLCNTSPKQRLSDYQHELLANRLLQRNYLGAIEQGKIPQKYARYEDRILLSEANVINFYALIREIEPSVVVETGTATGSMTSWILAALEANNKGQLISIDIPPTSGRLTMDMTVTKEEIGFLIPPEYHDRWTYIPGDAKVMLPKILAENVVDVFFHDSLHTRTHMLFEYNTARCLMKPNTVLMSDDILWNGAFFDFVRSHLLPSVSCISNPNIGLAINLFDQYELDIGTEIIHV
jgi:predicted O-methyltransferase YrrM